MGFWGKEFHPEYMPTSLTQCGWCDYLDTHDSRGTKYWCSKTRSYCTLKEKCSSFRDARDRTRDELRELCTWHISTMIGRILGKDLNQKPFSAIKELREFAFYDKTKNQFVELYDVYGELIATGLYFDANRVNVSEAMMPILNKVSDLVDNNNYEEAFNSYYQMVMMLYTRYNHSLVNNSEFDYQNETINLEEQPKIFIK